jgi:NAD(P)-dependent dehydrogenase (short-subunit alcohol dehydrogenase family)
MAGDTMFSAAGRVALVTGAATGLGQAISVALARAGADLAISDRPEVPLAATAALLAPHGRRVLMVPIDVRDPLQIAAGAATAERELGRVDILVNNAGINRPAPALAVTADDWDDHFHTNVRGGFLITQALARGMIARGWGRVIFLSSQSGVIGIPGQPVYCATKGAVIQLVRTLAVEWARHGITVNSIAPTFVETDLTRKRLQNPEFLRFVLGKIPGGRLALPEHIAAAAVYLASEEAAMVNGETHRVDGGWTAW